MLVEVMIALRLMQLEPFLTVLLALFFAQCRTNFYPVFFYTYFLGERYLSKFYIASSSQDFFTSIFSPPSVVKIFHSSVADYKYPNLVLRLHEPLVAFLSSQ